MQIDKNSWHCKVYGWWYRNKYGCKPKQSNLCPYMRAVIFWAPIRAVFGTWVKVWKMPVNAITLPLLALSVPESLGYLSYNAKMCVWFVYAGSLGISALMAITFGIYLAFSSDGLGWGQPIAGGIEKVANSSFLGLIHEYLRAGHDRICPEVSWTAPRNGDPIDEIMEYLDSL